MPCLRIPDSARASSRGWIAHHAGTVRAGAWVAILIAAVCPAQDPSRPPGFWPDKATAPNPANPPRDAHMQLERESKRGQILRYAAANAERKRQLEQESALLLQLAAELEAELARAGHEAVPSASAVRKAETIEKLAHTVKEKMKLTAAAG
jgi:hypothetical protein